jgi:predicted membrane GTPase involved in stress response
VLDEWFDEEKCIEVTPVNIRIRKRALAEKDRSVVRRK